MHNLETIGQPPWDRDSIVAAIPEFEDLYNSRPIRDNNGGMKAPHMFATWFMARHFCPEVIIESGIWKGQSTWLLEKACPDARLISIDLNLAKREYISRHAEYYDIDFSEIDWSKTPVTGSLVFFDDHQNAFLRLQQCRWFGFRDIIFEDNYPSLQGDCYSLKKAFEGAGFEPMNSDRGNRGSEAIRRRVGRLLGITPITLTPQYARRCIAPNTHDAAILRNHLDVYYEFPPVYKPDTTRWGDSWTMENYPTPAPLIGSAEPHRHPVFWDEAVYYTWICYVRLNEQFQHQGLLSQKSAEAHERSIQPGLAPA